MPILSQPPLQREPVAVDGVTYYKSDWMEHGQDPSFSPNVFLVEQPPNITLRTHFHRQNQFQLFIDGDAKFGRHSIGALTVHYAGAYTGYGPITAGPRGLTYLTLRPIYDTGKLNMPENAMDMIRGPKRQLSSDTVAVIDDTALAAHTGAQWLDMIALQADAVAARLYTLAPGERTRGLDPNGSGGQFYVVVAGALEYGGQTLRRPTSLFIRAQEAAFEIQASVAGAQVVCLQLALAATEYLNQRPRT